MRSRSDAWRSLWSRYARILAATWRQRRALDGPGYRHDEAAFLPDALTLSRSPVSPAGRHVLWLLIAMVSLIVLWAWFGRLDIVATAQGRIQASAGVPTLRSAGTVQAVHVREGQRVQAGEVLIEFDDVVPRAQRMRLEAEREIWQQRRQRALALIEAIERDLAQPASAATTLSQAITLAESATLAARLAGMDAGLARRRADHEVALSTLSRLQRTVVIARQRARALEVLAREQYVTRNSYLERERERIEQEAALEAQYSRVREAASAITELTQQRLALYEEARQTALNRVLEASEQQAVVEQELVKARRLEQMTRLTAPVSGTVQQLTVPMAGVTIPDSQALLRIIPQGSPLEVTGLLPNKDIGFVRPGQRVQVKVETFPYVEYGTVHGTVVGVSQDALEDERQGLVYELRVALDRWDVMVGGISQPLAPGMAVTIEIKTGRRRVMDYFLGPLTEYATQTLRDR